MSQRAARRSLALARRADDEARGPLLARAAATLDDARRVAKGPRRAYTRGVISAVLHEALEADVLRLPTKVTNLLPGVVVVDGPAAAREARARGARGILSRRASAEQIAAAAAAVALGLRVESPDFGEPSPDAEVVPSLTPREKEVLQRLVEGLSNKEIAQVLGISEHTAKFHVNAILVKLEVERRTEAVVRAARLGLVSL